MVQPKKSDTYVGGFVGRIDLKNTMVSNINNDVQIKNSYSVGDLELTSMFSDADSKNKAGLFVGDILYDYNSGNSKLVLRNNYTAGKYIYNSTLSGETSSKYFDALYNEKVNKGGFLGGFTIDANEKLQQEQLKMHQTCCLQTTSITLILFHMETVTWKA